VSDFKVGDKIEIVFHAISSYVGKRGKIMFVGTTLRQGTDMLENNINLLDQDSRLIVALDDSTIVNDIRDGQLRKV
jgi:hypothetical protein